MVRRSQANSGFTLIELIITISVVGVLAGAVLTGTYLASRQRVRDWQRKQAFRNFQLQLQDYYLDHGEYPPAGGPAPNGCGIAQSGEMCSCGRGSHPTDPDRPWGRCYWGFAFNDGVNSYGVSPFGYDIHYRVSPDLQEYQIYYQIRREDDPQAKEYILSDFTCPHPCMGIHSSGVTLETDPL